MNWSGKFENRCSAYGRCPEIFKLVPRSFQKKLGLHCRKRQKRFLSSQRALETLCIAMVAMIFVKKKGMIKLNERCSFIVTVKYLVIVVQSFADTATTS